MRRKTRQATTPGRGRALAELRRSSAAGTHRKRRPDRHNTRRRAIADARQ